MRRLGRVPPEGLHADHEPPRDRLEQVDDVRGGTGRAVGDLGEAARVRRGARLGQQRLLLQPVPGGDGRAQSRQRAGSAGPHLGGPQHREHEVDPLLRVRRVAQDVQAVADLHVLDLAQVPVHVQDEVVEGVGVRLVGHVQVLVELGRLDEGPDLRAHDGQLGRVQRLDRGVLVQELFELGQVAVRVRAGHRRHHVVDDDGVATALGLGPLARVVDDERVDQRQVAQYGVGRALRGQAQALAGQPFERAVLTEVDDGVGAERRVQPAVGGQVVVRRRQVGVVVDRHRVLPEAARRLDHQQHVPEPQ